MVYMTEYKSLKLSPLLLMLNTLAFMTFGATAVVAEELLVNTNTTLGDITKNKARHYFSQRLTHWPDGTPVILVVLADNDPLHIVFSKKILGLYPYQLRRAWDRQLYSGTGRTPIIAANEQEARNIIAMTPGSLGYVPGNPNNKKLRQMEVR